MDKKTIPTYQLLLVIIGLSLGVGVLTSMLDANSGSAPVRLAESYPIDEAVRSDTQEQLRAEVDRLPVFPGAVVEKSSPGTVGYNVEWEAATTVYEATEYYLAALTEDGWDLDTSGLVEDVNIGEQALTAFKDDFTLYLIFEQDGPGDTTEIEATLSNK